MKKHLNRKISCKKNLECLRYSDDQLLILTLLPHLNNNHILKEDEINNIKHTNTLNNNKNEVLNVLENIDKNKIKICEYCNTEFQKVIDLRKHLLINCFCKQKDNIELNKQIVDGNNNNINSNNISNSNNTTVNNITNNINLYIKNEVKKPVPFDDDWDISMISETIIPKLIISKIMYSSLLEEILKNEINLNIIIDKESQSGLVYMNDMDKYINMKSKDIVQKTMEKLKEQLQLYVKGEDKETGSFKDILDYCRRMIDKKYNDYVKYEDINVNVQHLFCNIFEKKKEDAIRLSQNVVDQNNLDKLNFKY